MFNICIYKYFFCLFLNFYMHETVHKQVLLLTLLAQSDISWDPSILIYVAIGHLFSLICSISIMTILHFCYSFCVWWTFGFYLKGFFFLAVLHGMWDLNSSTRDQICVCCSRNAFLTTGTLGSPILSKNFKSSYKQCCYGYLKICLLAHLHKSFSRVYTWEWSC